MDVAKEYRELAVRLRAMAAEPWHYSIRQRLLEVVRELERDADIRAGTQH